MQYIILLRNPLITYSSPISTSSLCYHYFIVLHVKNIPVWTGKELEEFLVDFAAHRSFYGHMSVPDKGTIMESFWLFGGVPQCKFHRARNDYEERSLRTSIEKLDTDACLKLFDGYFGDDDADKLVHMKCLDDTYSDYQYDFASQCVVEKVWQQLKLKSKLDTVHYLERLLGKSTTGVDFGSIFELVAHSLMAHGGNFRMKKVCKDGKLEATEDLQLGKLNREVFEELNDL